MSIWNRIVPKGSEEPLALVLYTRMQCPLCDQMKAEIERADRKGTAGRWNLSVVDIDADPSLVERYGRSIPVLEIDGRAAFKGRLDAEDLERKVAAALREREPA